MINVCGQLKICKLYRFLSYPWNIIIGNRLSCKFSFVSLSNSFRKVSFVFLSIYFAIQIIDIGNNSIVYSNKIMILLEY